MEEIKGSIEHIIYRNNGNGYTVLVVDCDGERVTASGNFPVLNEGECVVVSGEYRDTKYGRQIVAEKVEVAPPSDEESIFRYLSSGLIKGVGEVTAANIVEAFGADTLDVIERRPMELAKVKGISHRKAVDIANSFHEIRAMQKAVMFLQKIGISTTMAVRIYEAYGDKTQDYVLKNPYRLIEDIDGIGFSTADKIAASLGVREESSFRARAGIVYLLKDASGSGSTYLPQNLLADRLNRLLGGDWEEETVKDLVRELVVDGLVATLPRGDEVCVALSGLFHMEKKIASRLTALAASCEPLGARVDDEIAVYEKVCGIALHDRQREAVAHAVESGVAVITGGPGTGKTTIIRCILAILNARGLKTELVAPTGRAAKRLSEATGEPAKTIHRLLDLDFTGGRGHFTYNENTKLDAGAVIVDEVSMVDAYVMSSLLAAVRDGCRLILVGDKDQLPSVGAGNILADVIASGHFPVFLLTEIYRQAGESLIVTNAHRINRGEMPLLGVNDSDFFYSAKSAAEDILSTTLEMVTRRIPAYKGVRPEQIQVLCPMKKGVCGSLAINAELQQRLNPPDKGRAEYRLESGAVLRVGDKVMQTVNNYQLEWRRGLEETGLGVFNGDIGRIERILPGSGEVTVAFEDGRVATYSAVECTDLTLAYAISIHKSQGSEFDIVVLPVTGGHRALFTRNLLYTAVTRARAMVVLIGSRAAIKAMVDNDHTEKRYSLLEEFIAKAS